MVISSVKTKKFTLRPLKMSDVQCITKNANHKEIYRNTLRIPYPYRLKDAKIWIGDVLKKENKRNSTSLTFAIEINGEAAGAIGLNQIKDHSAEIGYWLGRKYWGQGIMTEALRVVTKIGFSKLKLRRIYGHVFIFNKRSANVLENVGYKSEGMLKKRFKKDGKFLDAYLFAKVR